MAPDPPRDSILWSLSQFLCDKWPFLLETDGFSTTEAYTRLLVPAWSNPVSKENGNMFCSAPRAAENLKQFANQPTNQPNKPNPKPNKPNQPANYATSPTNFNHPNKANTANHPTSQPAQTKQSNHQPPNQPTSPPANQPKPKPSQAKPSQATGPALRSAPLAAPLCSPRWRRTTPSPSAPWAEP